MFSRGPVHVLVPIALTLRPLNFAPESVLSRERPPLVAPSKTSSFVETAQAGRPETILVNSTVTKPADVMLMLWTVVALTLPAKLGELSANSAATKDVANSF